MSIDRQAQRVLSRWKWSSLHFTSYSRYVIADADADFVLALCFRLNHHCQKQCKSHEVHTNTLSHFLSTLSHTHTHTLSYGMCDDTDTHSRAYRVREGETYACSNTISHVNEMKCYIHISNRLISLLNLFLCVKSVMSSVCVFTIMGLVCREREREWNCFVICDDVLLFDFPFPFFFAPVFNYLYNFRSGYCIFILVHSKAWRFTHNYNESLSYRLEFALDFQLIPNYNLFSVWESIRPCNECLTNGEYIFGLTIA